VADLLRKWTTLLEQVSDYMSSMSLKGRWSPEEHARTNRLLERVQKKFQEELKKLNHDIDLLEDL